MSLDMFDHEMARTATVSTPVDGALNALGVPSRTPDTSTVDGYLEPLGAKEITVGQTTMIATHLFVAPPDAQISGRSTLTIDGDDYQVLGPPLRFFDGDDLHHLELNLASAEG